MSVPIKDGHPTTLENIFGDKQFNIDHLQGMSWLCRWLFTSPRMKKPQIELIEEQYYAIVEEIQRRQKLEKK